MIEAKKGGLYRTDDGGKTWALSTTRTTINQRAWYFNTVFADPKDPNTVYVLNTSLYRSIDGGKTFKTLQTAARRQSRAVDRPDQSAAA